MYYTYLSIICLLAIYVSSQSLYPFGHICNLDSECISGSCQNIPNQRFCCGPGGLTVSGRCVTLAGLNTQCILGGTGQSDNSLCATGLCLPTGLTFCILRQAVYSPYPIAPVLCNNISGFADTSFCARLHSNTPMNIACSHIVPIRVTPATCPSCNSLFEYCCTGTDTVPCSTLNPLGVGTCCKPLDHGSSCTAHWQCSSGICNILSLYNSGVCAS